MFHTEKSFQRSLNWFTNEKDSYTFSVFRQCVATKSLLLLCVAQILRVLGESAIAVRTKAMKCLSEVVAVDPSILARVSGFSQIRHKKEKA